MCDFDILRQCQATFKTLSHYIEVDSVRLQSWYIFVHCNLKQRTCRGSTPKWLVCQENTHDALFSAWYMCNWMNYCAIIWFLPVSHTVFVLPYTFVVETPGRRATVGYTAASGSCNHSSPISYNNTMLTIMFFNFRLFNWSQQTAQLHWKESRLAHRKQKVWTCWVIVDDLNSKKKRNPKRWILPVKLAETVRNQRI